MSEARFVEATGPDVETAIQNGLAVLGVKSKDVIVEVLEEASRGLFGIGSHQARVRLTVLAPTQPAVVPAAPAAAPPAPAPDREAEGPDLSGEDEGLYAEEVLEQGIAPEPGDALARAAVAALHELLGHMGITANITPYYVPAAADEDSEAPLVLQVSGRDLGMLIGRRGETLAALQYITRLIVSRDIQRRANIIVDVERYKARREKRLRDLALRMAKQAVQRGRTVALEPMPPYERRIVHLALKDRTDVYTQSVGEGEHRKVTIVPVRDR